MRAERSYTMICATLLLACVNMAAFAGYPGGIEIVALPSDAQFATYEERPVLIVERTRTSSRSSASRWMPPSASTC